MSVLAGEGRRDEMAWLIDVGRSTEGEQVRRPLCIIIVQWQLHLTDSLTALTLTFTSSSATMTFSSLVASQLEQNKMNHSFWPAT